MRSGAEGPGLDAEARAWLNERELGEVVRVLGEVGSSLADLAMLTAEDVEALNLKVVLAACMWHNPHILILDEPTNYF